MWRGTLRKIDLSIGDEFIEKAFSSSTFKEEVAVGFARGRGTVFEIRVPRGTKGLPITQESGILSSEFEILLQSGTKYRVVDIVKGDFDKIIVEVVN